MKKRFRGKCLESGKIVFGDVVDANNTYILTEDQKEYMVVSGSLKTTVELVIIDPKTLSENTGIKDANGVDMYENDHVMLIFPKTEHSQGSTRTGTVERRGCEFILHIHGTEYYHQVCHYKSLLITDALYEVYY